MFQDIGLLGTCEIPKNFFVQVKLLLLIVIMRGTIALLSMLPVIHNKDYTIIRIEQT